MLKIFLGGECWFDGSILVIFFFKLGLIFGLFNFIVEKNKKEGVNRIEDGIGVWELEIEFGIIGFDVWNYVGDLVLWV